MLHGRSIPCSFVGEVQLSYDRAIVPQETGWWCGPAATQVVLNASGIKLAESSIAAEIEQIENPGRGDDRDGTDYVGIIERFLDRQLPAANYTSVYMPDDPPTREQRDRLWRDLRRSLDAGYGVVANLVVPPTNLPAATKGSTPPPYPRFLTTYHYVALMGYDEASRAVWVADSAAFGGITGWWCPFEGRGGLASLIPPKGYCFADADLAAEPPPVTARQPDGDQDGDDTDDRDLVHASRSPYRENNAQIMTALDAILNIDAMCHAGLVVEPAALRGELWAIEKVARLANGEGPGSKLWFDAAKNDEWAISKARFLLDLIERTNPEALVRYLAAKGNLP